MTESNNAHIVDALVSIGASLVDIKSVGENGKPFAVLPKDFYANDVESLLGNPVRKRGITKTTETDSFINFLDKHADPLASMIYADINYEASNVNLVAVINDHAATKANWGDFRCGFSPKISVEYGRWASANGKHFSQAEFASFLEDNLGDIASLDGFPTGAQMLQMALAFEANSDKKFRSKINLQSGGVQFEFVEDETKNTRTTMVAFERFMLGIPVFDGSTDAYPIEARLKYREKDGSLKFWFELIRLDRVFKTATQTELDKISSRLSIPIIKGVPASIV